jgi:hypothetical protein
MIELAAAKPAGGAALDQVAIATGGAIVATGLLLWLILGHRSGKVPWLTRAADRSASVSGLPHWAALPAIVSAVSLLVALLGMYWDIALHIGVGRDEGPLANPAHYLILVGLYGVFAAGVLAIALPREDERPGPAAIRITRGWYAPVGGLLMAVCGGFALLGFPLDDVWHRLFGQDVTLWGPTHLMLIGGAGMTLVGQAVLLAEGMRARRMGDAGADGRVQMPSRLVAFRRMGIVGGFLIGLSTFQAEFDFGVPQYSQVFHPFLIALAAGVALVAGRLWIGRGGALLSVVFFLVTRGIIDLVTGPLVFHEPYPTTPLYLGSAVLVELAALALAARPLLLGAASGALIGTIGFATEWAWTQVAFKLPWQADLLPEGVVYAVAGGMAGGVIGALLALGLRGRLPRPGVARPAFAAAGLVVAACIATLLFTTVPSGVTARIQLADLTGGAQDREGQATVRITPPAAAEDAKWLTVTSWQGGGLHVDRLERQGPGVFRTTEPMPLHPDWKTLVRLHKDHDLTAAAIYMPEDPAIPAKEIPAQQNAERPFVKEVELLQRERKDVAPWLWAVASGVVLALYVAFLGALAWGVGRLSRRWDDEVTPPDATPAEPRFERTPTGRPMPAT